MEDDGNYYGLPFFTQRNAANGCIVVNGKWLKNLGLTYPTKISEMTEMLRAATQDDPDQDGKNDTFGYGSSNFAWVYYAFGREYGDYGLTADGKVTAWFDFARFPEAMTYIKNLYGSGFIDPEYMISTAIQNEEKFYQGTIGSCVFALFRHVSRIEGNLKAVDPDTWIEYGLPPADDAINALA